MQQQQGPQVDITATTEVLCECGNPCICVKNLD